MARPCEHVFDPFVAQQANQEDFSGLCVHEACGATSLVRAGVPIATLAPRRFTSRKGDEFYFIGRRSASPDCKHLRRHARGRALIALTGVACDVIDVDPRNGGSETFLRLQHHVKSILALVETPGGGRHLYVPPAGLGSVSSGGIDYLGAGKLVYLPGTSRPKYQGRGYQWLAQPDFTGELQPSPEFIAALRRASAERRAEPAPQLPTAAAHTPSADVQLLGAFGLLAWVSRDVADAPPGVRNSTLFAKSVRLGRVVGSEPSMWARVERCLLEACHRNGLVRDNGVAACQSTIRSGLEAGSVSRGAHDV